MLYKAAISNLRKGSWFHLQLHAYIVTLIEACEGSLHASDRDQLSVVSIGYGLVPRDERNRKQQW